MNPFEVLPYDPEDLVMPDIKIGDLVFYSNYSHEGRPVLGIILEIQNKKQEMDDHRRTVCIHWFPVGNIGALKGFYSLERATKYRKLYEYNKDRF